MRRGTPLLFVYGFVVLFSMRIVLISFSGSCISYKKRYEKNLKNLPQKDKDELLLDNVRRNTNGDLDRDLIDLIRAGADIHKRGVHDRTLLHEAALAKGASSIVILLAHGVKPDDQDFYECSPLHYAASTCDIELAKLLLSSGASIMLRNKQGRTPKQEAQLSYQGVKVEPFLRLLSQYHAAD